MPGILRGFIGRAADLAGSELVLHDLHSEHLELMGQLARRMFAAAGRDAGIDEPDQLHARVAADLEAALVGVDYVLTTFRPGGLPARHIDETIPLRHGVVGQETAGPGGFLMACRSVPVLLRIAEILSQRSPGAWIVNYTNPTSIVTDAVSRFSGARILGLCDQWVGDTARWAALLGYPAATTEADWFGLNHATWAERIRVDGLDVSVAVRDALRELRPDDGMDAGTRRLVELGALFECLPNSYAPYYFFHDEILAEQRARGTSRAQDLMALMPGYYANYEAEAAMDAPDPIRDRGGADHGDFAVEVIAALANDERRRLIVNVRNRGAVADLPHDAIVEVPAIVGRDGATPLVMGRLPRPLGGLTVALHEYEWQAAAAAATGDRRLALRALACHPLVRSTRVAARILDDGLAAHRDDVPQFAPAAPA